MRLPVPVTALCLILFAGALQPAQALRCDRRIVNEQDKMIEVLAHCGEPTLRDRHPPANRYGGGYFSYPEETWYYNFGPNRLLHVLQFRHSQLVRIETDGYGFIPPSNSRCRPNDIRRGMSKLRLLASCGEPAQRDAYYQLRPQFVRGHVVGHVGVLRESWHYNFGPRRLLREVILINGEVRDIKTETTHGY